MTLSTTTNKIVHEADGSNDTFTYNFKIFAASDLKVYENNVLTVLAYTVSGVGNPAGGEIVFTTTVPGDGVLVTLIRESPYTQQTDYTAYGPFPAETHEDTLDKVVILVQQLKEEVSRCLRLPKWNESDPVELDMTISEDVTNKILGYNALGDLSLRASTALPAGVDLDMDGNDIILNSGAILAKNNDVIAHGRNAADSAWLELLKLNSSNLLEALVQMKLPVGGWTEIAEVATTSGTYKDISIAIPAWVTEVELLMKAVSVDTVNLPPCARMGTSPGTWLSSGYVAQVGAAGAVDASVNEIPLFVASDYAIDEEISGLLRFTRYDSGADLWFFTGHMCSDIQQEVASIMGFIAGVTPWGGLRLVTATGVPTFNGGAARLRYR